MQDVDTMSAMTTTYGISLPPVDGAHIGYAGCGSHQLEVTVHLNGEFGYNDFIHDMVTILRENCHHSPIDGHNPYAPRLVRARCRFCDAEILPEGPDADGRQSWVLAP